MPCVLFWNTFTYLRNHQSCVSHYSKLEQMTRIRPDNQVGVFVFITASTSQDNWNPNCTLGQDSPLFLPALILSDRTRGSKAIFSAIYSIFKDLQNDMDLTEVFRCPEARRVFGQEAFGLLK